MLADATSTEPVRLGAIDCGSNAIRVVVAEARGPGHLDQIAYQRAPVRLGKRAFTRGQLHRTTMNEAVATFQRFRALFDEHDVQHYRAVATSALRNANNSDALVHRLYHEAGIELEVIDGDEEARLVRKAVQHAFNNRTSPRAVLDLGGGSLEVNLRKGSSWRGLTLPIGTVRLLETFDLGGSIGHEEAGMIRRYAASLLRTIRLEPDHELRPAAACGGNAVALARLFGGTDDLGMKIIELSSLENALPALLDSTVEERMARYEVRRDRAEVMGVAALVLTTVCRVLRLGQLFVPNVGLRDALLLDLAERLSTGDVESAHGKALLTAARTFAQRVGHDITHGEYVRRMARSIFDQMADVHQLSEDLGVLLELAALLHDIGEVINPRSHHKHSEYMIRWGRIPGLQNPYREMVAALVRTHRKSVPNINKHQGYAALPDGRRDQVLQLAAILRLADALDTQHRQMFDDVFVSRLGDSIALDLVVGHRRATDSIDRSQLLRKAQLFQDVFEHSLTLTIGTASPVPASL